jgi:hypothetical protein
MVGAQPAQARVDCAAQRVGAGPFEVGANDITIDLLTRLGEQLFGTYSGQLLGVSRGWP